MLKKGLGLLSLQERAANHHPHVPLWAVEKPDLSRPYCRLWAAQRYKRLLQTSQSEVTFGSPLCALVVTLDQQNTFLAIRSIV